MKVLSIGSTGTPVIQWQTFLRGQGFVVPINGSFGLETQQATEHFQKRHRLAVDGVVGNQTLGKAALLGFEIVPYFEFEGGYPSRPPFPALESTRDRQRLFGTFAFVHAPTAANPERIAITDGWQKNSIVTIQIPELQGVSGATPDGSVRCHRVVAAQFQGLWRAWRDRGLLPHVLSYGGDFVPRFVRGLANQQVLSNHAFGTAFDINEKWNPLGAEPATSGERGCVYELVSVAHEFGFYWGGHFTRRDGMHFEIARVL